MAKQNAIANKTYSLLADTTVWANTFNTNVAAAAVTLSGTTLAALGSDADIGIDLIPKGLGSVVVSTTVGASGFFTTNAATSLLMAVNELSALGANADIDIKITPKGFGTVVVSTGVKAGVFDTDIPAASLQISGTTINAVGSDGNIDINLTAKGTGSTVISNLTTGLVASDVNGKLSSTVAPSGLTSISATTMYATTFDTAVVAAALTLSGTTLAGVGTDADVNITLTPQGAGVVNFSNITTYGAVCSSSSGTLSSTGAGSAGQLLVSSGAGAVPAWTTATYPGTIAKGDVVIGTNANAVGVVATAGATATYVLTANGAGNLPTWEAPTGGGGGGITFSVITADQAFTVNNGFICNKAGTLTLTLPATAAAGAQFEVTGINTATGWKVQCNTGQKIYFGTLATTITTGYIASTAIRDSVRLVCVVADTDFNVLSSIGNITIV